MALLPKLAWNRQDSKKYNDKINMEVQSLGVRWDNTPVSIENLVKIIVHSADSPPRGRNPTYKQKWFDSHCFKARKVSFKWLRIFRKTNTIFAKDMYIRANKRFKSICQLKKQLHYSSLASQLGSITNAKEWWTTVKEIRGGVFITGANISIREYHDYFVELLNPGVPQLSLSYAEPQVDVPILDLEITLDEMCAALKKAKDNKARGYDRVTYEFYKNAPLSFLQKLCASFNDIYTTGEVPDSFRRAIIFPIYKKGNPDMVQNYRGLSFMDVVAKIFVSVLLQRLNRWGLERKLLNEYQAGFREGYSTVDNLFNLISLIRLSWMNGKKKIYCFFVDFKAAFDTVNRKALFYKLYNMGVSTKFIKVLRSMYTNTQAAVWNGTELSDWLGTCTGLKQGCPMSPVLFAYFVNDLHDNIGGGLTVAGIHVRILLYADDLVLISDRSGTLQEMIVNLEAYCNTWSLEVNLDKSKIMIFSRGGGIRGSRESWAYKGQEIEVVNSYKYLGTILTPKLSFKKHLEDRLNAAKTSINLTWKNFLQNDMVLNSAKIQVYNAVTKSIMCYGSQIWGYMYHEEVEKLQRYFVKKLLGLQQTTPNYMIGLETGLPDLYIYTLGCHFTYVTKALTKMGDDRLPNRLARVAMERSVWWYEAWSDLGEKHGIRLNMDNLTQTLPEILNRETAFTQNYKIERARQSIRHGFYNELSYKLDNTYFLDSFSIQKIRYIFKCRGGLLWLNSNPWRSEGSSRCSMCNMEEDEDLLHFLAICPILIEFRLRAFKKRTLTRDEVVQYLNGKDWDALFLYAKEALMYRATLIAEYNS